MFCCGRSSVKMGHLFSVLLLWLCWWFWKIAYESGPMNPAEHRSTLRIASNNRIAAQPDPFKMGTISTNFGGLPSGRVRSAQLIRTFLDEIFMFSFLGLHLCH
jgi:hypothetical protein